MFKHELGKLAQSRVTLLSGILTARSENLYMCNRYYLQPQVNAADQKVPEGWWVDEDDVSIIGVGVLAEPKTTGGPMSRNC